MLRHVSLNRLFLKCLHYNEIFLLIILEKRFFFKANKQTLVDLGLEIWGMPSYTDMLAVQILLIRAGLSYRE